MQDKRLTHRLTEYWNNMRGEDPLPAWVQFDPNSFDGLWKKCCGWKVEAIETSTIVYTYEHMGDMVKAVAGDLTGQKFEHEQKATHSRAARAAANASPQKQMLLTHFKNMPAARILQKIDRVVQKPAIVIEEGRVLDGDGKNVRFRSCLLPFGTKEGAVTHMVLGLSWKAY